MTKAQVLSAGKLAASALVTRRVRSRVLRAQGLIFMLHRFRNPDLRVSGIDPYWLRTALAYLRRQGHALVPLDQLLRGLLENPSSVNGAIAFTIDDGYADQAEIAAPVFAEFDCPVTTFVTSGFLDGKLWFWWDRISFVFSHTTVKRVRFHIEESVFDFPLDSAVAKQRAQAEFTARCKAISVSDKLHAIEALAGEAGVALPETAPAEYRPMSWDDVRACESLGMSFGPHTVTHPILSRTTDSQSAFEIAESWRRLRMEARSPVPIFCYPNGQLADFGDREWSTLARIGFSGAVTGTPGYVQAAGLQEMACRCLLPRYAMPEDMPDLAQVASGLERIKQLLTSSVRS